MANGKNVTDALKSFGEIAEKGSQWGLVLLDKKNPTSLYTYTQGSPLLIGFSRQEDQVFVVSEKLAFQDLADCYFPTNDGEIF